CLTSAVVPENPIRADSRDEVESAHHSRRRATSIGRYAAVFREPDNVCLHCGDVVYRASSRSGDVELQTPLPALGRRLTGSGDADLNQGRGTNKLLEVWL